MTGFVSDPRVRVAALAAPMAIISIVLILHGFPWAGLLSASLALAALRRPPSAVATSERALRSKGTTP
jgi:hypothetical protein